MFVSGMRLPKIFNMGPTPLTPSRKGWGKIFGKATTTDAQRLPQVPALLGDDKGLGSMSGGRPGVVIEEREGRVVIVTIGTVLVEVGAEEVHDGLAAEDGFAGADELGPLGVFGWGDEVLGAGELGHADGEEGQDLDGTVALVLVGGLVVDQGVVEEDPAEGGDLVFEGAVGASFVGEGRGTGRAGIEAMLEGVVVTFGCAAAARGGVLVFGTWFGHEGTSFSGKTVEIM